MNFHFLVDDKFTNDYIKTVLEISNDNLFYYISKKPIKYIDYSQGKIVQYGKELFAEVIEKIKPNDTCIFHWLSPECGEFVSKLPNNIKKVLLLMGGDVFEYPSSIHKYYVYDPISLAYFNKKIPKLLFNKWYAVPFQFAKQIFMNYIKPIYDKSRYQKKLKGIRSFNIIGHWNKFDIELLRERDQMTANLLPYYYEVGLNNDLPNKFSNNDNYNIWVGNSATLSNNHLDLFEILKNLTLPDNYKIYTPLSYGNNELANYIEKKGKDYFGDHFIAIKGYLPRTEYYNLLNSCNFFIMFHNRMQAAGNIFALMKMGKKLFLKPNSTTYKEYCSEGAYIYNTDELFNNPLKMLVPLSEDQKIKNQEVVSQIANEVKKRETLNFILNKFSD